MLDCVEVSKVSGNFMKGDHLVLRSVTQVLNTLPLVRFKAEMSTDVSMRVFNMQYIVFPSHRKSCVTVA